MLQLGYVYTLKEVVRLGYRLALAQRSDTFDRGFVVAFKGSSMEPQGVLLPFNSIPAAIDGGWLCSANPLRYLSPLKYSGDPAFAHMILDRRRTQD